MEIFKDIEGFEGLYQVSNDTTIKSVERTIIRKNGSPMHVKEKIRKQTLDSDGYLVVTLWKNGVPENKKVHQLVAQAFIENPHGYEHVHHKDKNQLNNHVENLEWISKEEHHALHDSDRVEAVREAKSKVVYQYEDGEIVNVWRSTREAARILGFSEGNISACCRGGYYDKSRGGKWHKVETYKSYGWSYSPLYTKKRQDDLSLALI